MRPRPAEDPGPQAAPMCVCVRAFECACELVWNMCMEDFDVNAKNPLPQLRYHAPTLEEKRKAGFSKVHRPLHVAGSLTSGSKLPSPEIQTFSDLRPWMLCAKRPKVKKKRWRPRPKQLKMYNFIIHDWMQVRSIYIIYYSYATIICYYYWMFLP
jgi:hypothetical protein